MHVCFCLHVSYLKHISSIFTKNRHTHFVLQGGGWAPRGGLPRGLTACSSPRTPETSPHKHLAASWAYPKSREPVSLRATPMSTPAPCAVALAALGPPELVPFGEWAHHPSLLKEPSFPGRQESVVVKVAASGFPSGLVRCRGPSSMILEDCVLSPGPFWVVVITAGVKMSRMVLQASQPWGLRRAARWWCPFREALVSTCVNQAQASGLGSGPLCGQ